jgi:hypothetical protein
MGISLEFLSPAGAVIGTPVESVLTFSDDAVVHPVALLDIRLAQSKSESGTLFRQLTGNQATSAPISEYHFPAVNQKRALLPGMTAKS